MLTGSSSTDLPRVKHVTFRQWVGGREIEHLSTNDGALPLAFQRWRNFKEAFAPELVGRALEETSAALGRTVSNCIDPFGGSGTTALSCQFLGIKPYTIEVNPFLCDLIMAKVTTYDIDSLIADFDRVIKNGGRRTRARPLAEAPDTFVEPGVDGRFIFYYSVAERLSLIARRITGISSIANQRLLRVLLGSIAVECSNVIVSGKGRRYRSGWMDTSKDAEYVDVQFREAFLQAIYDIQRYRNRPSLEADVHLGDARERIPTRRKFDMSVFSPPYPNSFDYTDVYNVELWVCGYLKSATDNRLLRNSTLRSHVQILRSYDGLSRLDSETLSETYSALAETRKNLWNKHIPEMVHAYFYDMVKIMDGISSCLRDGALCFIVVGDSRYGSVTVPVAQILQDLAVGKQLEVISTKPYRSMRASPQQGGRKELLETLVTFRRTPR